MAICMKAQVRDMPEMVREGLGRREVWGGVGIYGEMWGDVGRYGVIWGDMG